MSVFPSGGRWRGLLAAATLGALVACAAGARPPADGAPAEPGGGGPASEAPADGGAQTAGAGLGAGPAPGGAVGDVDGSPSAVAVDGGRPDVAEALTAEVFDAFQDRRGGISFVKLVVVRGDPAVIEDDRLYFFDPAVHPLHIGFLRDVGLVKRGEAEALQASIWRAEDRPFIFANLARYPSPEGERWALELFENDEASPQIIAELFQVVAPRAFVGGELHFKPNSLAQARLADAVAALGVPVVDNRDLALDLPFIVQNRGRPAVGPLRVAQDADPLAVQTALYDRREIVLLETLPNDITRVAGIITTEPTTPLSHVNLRARSWDIPNVMIKDALSLAWREGGEGRPVYLAVGEDGVPVFRLATPEEVERAAMIREARPRMLIPRVDLGSAELRPLSQTRATDLPVVGAKAANLGELMYLGRSEGDVVVPPGLTVPFAVYAAFLALPENRGITEALDAALADPRFQADAAYRRDQLAALRARIRQGTFPPAHREAILAQVRASLGEGPVFVRSSTNSEDLPTFNGAGLYDTVANVEGEGPLVAAILRVWASVWNFGAFEAREDAGIDHRSVYPAAIIQQAVRPDAAGVLITRDVFAPERLGRVYLNANPGPGTNVVQTGMRPEEIYVEIATGEVRRVTLSQGATAPVISDEVARRLARLGQRVEAHFASLAGGETAPQDIEWLVVGETIYLVQARPWLGPQ